MPGCTCSWCICNAPCSRGTRHTSPNTYYVSAVLRMLMVPFECRSIHPSMLGVLQCHAVARSVAVKWLCWKVRSNTCLVQVQRKLMHGNWLEQAAPPSPAWRSETQKIAALEWWACMHAVRASAAWPALDSGHTHSCGMAASINDKVRTVEQPATPAACMWVLVGQASHLPPSG